jgi:hypothetical protein
MEGADKNTDSKKVEAWVVDDNGRLLYTCPPGNARVMLKNGEAESVRPKNKADKQFKIRIRK